MRRDELHFTMVKPMQADGLGLAACFSPPSQSNQARLFVKTGGGMPIDSRHRFLILASLVLSLYTLLLVCVIVRRVGVLKNVHDHRALHRIAQLVSGSYIDRCTPPTEWSDRESFSDACPELSKHLLSSSIEARGAYTERVGPPSGTSYRLWSATGTLRECTVWEVPVVFEYVYRLPDINNRGMETLEITSCEPVK